MKYSIIIVTYQRVELLQKCISEIRKQTPTAQILVGINGPDQYALNYLQNIPQVTCKSFQKMSPGEVRNELIKLVETPWICFLDDDVIPCENYFKMAEDNMAIKSLDIFGGPDTAYPDENKLEAAISLALTSPLATAQSRKRHTVSDDFKTSATEQDYILCNLWMKTSIFQADGNKFDARFFRNEENVLLIKVLKEARVAHYYGNFYVHHKRKNNLIYMILTVMKSANYRAKSFRIFPKSFQLIYTVPSIAFLYLIYLMLNPNLIGLIPVILYLIILIFFSYRICSRARRMNLFPHVLIIQGLINLSYAIGFISPPKTTK